MTAAPADFAERYARALTDFLALSDEAGLEQAYELGREAISQGLGVLDLAAIHTEAFGHGVPPSSGDVSASTPASAAAGPDVVPHRTWQFFAEALAPFEMALRGFREANVALREATTTLEERVLSRTRDLKAAERALHEQARLLRCVVESIADGIVVADPSGKVLLVNRAGAAILGTTAADLPEKWAAPRGLYEGDRTTPFPESGLPLAPAMAGQQTAAIPMFVRNAAIPDGVDLSVIGSPLRNDEGGVEGGVVVFRDVTDAKRAEDDLRRSTEHFRLMFKASPLPMWTYDRTTLAFVSVNDAAVRHYGYSREEFTSMTLADLRPPEDLPASRADLEAPGAMGTWRHRKKDGTIILVEVTANDLELDARRVRLVLANDVTEREKAQETLRKTEEQLRQSQKMDALGRLAGGVAHDFNNVLSVILSYSDMLMSDLQPDDPARSDIEEISTAGHRAADLTRQLLMFSRQQVLEPKVLDLNELLLGMDKMLRRILGADVDLVSVPATKLGTVRADRGSIEQVIVNLVVNARDAMPTGGKLTMETGNVVLDEQYAREHPGAKPGPHVMLAVTDTGTGMDRATLTRIFEPFFTTKGIGKGTGLGLSTVFGIVQVSGGTVWVYSEPGKGTTFKVYLPRVDAAADALVGAGASAPSRGSETILLVDDDDQVRLVTRAILRRNGYQVLDARNAGEALLYCEEHPGTIDLLLTDVVMPHVSGPELAKRLRAQRKDMKLLCMSGYTDDSIMRHGVLESHIAYIQKPVTPETLTNKVRAVLDGAAEAAGGP